MSQDFSLYREFTKTMSGFSEDFPLLVVRSFLKNLSHAAFLAVATESRLAHKIELIRKSKNYQEALTKAINHVPQTRGQQQAAQRLYFSPLRELKKARAANHQVVQPLVRAFKEGNRYLSLMTSRKKQDAEYSFAVMAQFLAKAMHESQKTDVDALVKWAASPHRFIFNEEGKTHPRGGVEFWNDFVIHGEPSFQPQLRATTYVQSLEALLGQALATLEDSDLPALKAKAATFQRMLERLQSKSTNHTS